MRVYVKTPSRLHLGVIDPTGGLGRIYGSVGVAIDEPNVILEASPNPQLSVVGEQAEPVEAAAKRFLKFHGLKAGAHIHVRRMIPQHVGLGSGTQLSLAVASALAKLFGIKASARELATVTGRGSVSGIGTAAFEGGGFIVDGGHRLHEGRNVISASAVPPLIIRWRFPENWFFVVAIPRVERGLSGEAERSAFKTLREKTAKSSGEICRLILMKMLPALEERNLEAFGDSLTRVQRLVGETFRPLQGGTFSDPAGASCIRFMLREGAYGAGQSSWGPTVYGLVQGREAAEALKEKVKQFISQGAGGQVFYAVANKRGAYIRVFK